MITINFFGKLVGFLLLATGLSACGKFKSDGSRNDSGGLEAVAAGTNNLGSSDENTVYPGRYFYGNSIAAKLEDGTPANLCVARTGGVVPDLKHMRVVFWASSDCKNTKTDAATSISMNVGNVTASHTDADKTIVSTFDLQINNISVGSATITEQYLDNSQFYQDQLTLNELCTGPLQTICSLNFTHKSDDSLTAITLEMTAGKPGGVVTDHSAEAVNSVFYWNSSVFPAEIADATATALCAGRARELPKNASDFMTAFWFDTPCNAHKVPADKVLLFENKLLSETKDQNGVTVRKYLLSHTDSAGIKTEVGSMTASESSLSDPSYYSSSFEIDELCTGKYKNVCELIFTHRSNLSLASIRLEMTSGKAGGVISDRSAQTVDALFYWNGSTFNYPIDNGTTTELCAGRSGEDATSVETYKVGIWFGRPCANQKILSSDLLLFDKKLLSQTIVSTNGNQQTTQRKYTLTYTNGSIRMQDVGSITTLETVFTDNSGPGTLYSSSMEVDELCSGKYQNACALVFTHNADQSLASIRINIGAGNPRGVISDLPAQRVDALFYGNASTIDYEVGNGTPTELCVGRAEEDLAVSATLKLGVWFGKPCNKQKVIDSDILLFDKKLLSETVVSTSNDQKITERKYTLAYTDATGKTKDVGSVTIDQTIFTNEIGAGSLYNSWVELTELCTSSYKDSCKLSFTHKAGQLSSMTINLGEKGIATDFPANSVATGWNMTDTVSPDILKQISAPLCFARSNAAQPDTLELFSFIVWSSAQCGNGGAPFKIPATAGTLLRPEVTTRETNSSGDKVWTYDLFANINNVVVKVGTAQGVYHDTSDPHWPEISSTLQDLCTGSYSNVCQLEVAKDNQGDIVSLQVVPRH